MHRELRLLYRNTAARGAHRLTKNFRPVLNIAFSPNFRKFAPRSRSWICGCRCALKYGAGAYDLSSGAAPRSACAFDPAYRYAVTAFVPSGTAAVPLPSGGDMKMDRAS